MEIVQTPPQLGLNETRARLERKRSEMSEIGSDNNLSQGISEPDIWKPNIITTPNERRERSL